MGEPLFMGCCPVKENFSQHSDVFYEPFKQSFKQFDKTHSLNTSKFPIFFAKSVHLSSDAIGAIEIERENIRSQMKKLQEDYKKILEAEKNLKIIEKELQDAEKQHLDWMQLKQETTRLNRKETSFLKTKSRLFGFAFKKRKGPFKVHSYEPDNQTKMYVEIDGEKVLADAYLNSFDYPNSHLYIGHYRLLMLIGKGCCAKVIMASDTRKNMRVALKVVKKDVTNTSIILSEKMAKDLLSPNWHPFIMKIFSIYQTNAHFVFVMEFLEGRSLNIHLTIETKFTEEKTTFYSACILLAIGYLHSLDISHRDVKLENIVLDRLGYPKLIDFGMAEENVKHNTPIFEKSGTRLYQGPEFYLPGMMTRRSSDFWALGVSIHAMLTGNFISINPTVIDHAHLSKVAADLLKKMFVLNPLERLGAGEDGASDLMKHNFFKKTDWEGLLQRKISAPTFTTKPYDLQPLEDVWRSFNTKKIKTDMGLKDIEWIEVKNEPPKHYSK